MPGFSDRPRCRICSLPLRAKKSVLAGIGPECKKKLAWIRMKKAGRIGRLVGRYVSNESNDN